MILSYSSTEFIRFNAIMAFPSMSGNRFFYGGLGGISNSLFSFSILSSLIYACSQASTSQYKCRLHVTFGTIF